MDRGSCYRGATPVVARMCCRDSVDSMVVANVMFLVTEGSAEIVGFEDFVVGVALARASEDPRR